jgi:hypothetical protein
MQTMSSNVSPEHLSTTNLESHASSPNASPRHSSRAHSGTSSPSLSDRDLIRTLKSLRTPTQSSGSSVHVTPPMLTLDQVNELFTKMCDTMKPKKEENPLHLARLESFISQGLTFKFDGDQNNLPPWANKFRALRTNALWRKATYITISGKTYDILMEFPSVPETDIRAQAIDRCSSDNQLKSLQLEHQDLFYSRILGNVIIHSVTEEFHTTLQNYAGRQLCTDGPLLLWLIMTHFHTSTLTYQDNLRQSIRNRSLHNNHNGDAHTYLIWIRHQLDTVQSTILSTSDTLTDLVEPIFQQLLSTHCTRLSVRSKIGIYNTTLPNFP